ncbi:hypothetical protein VPH35_088373 [Triticum aestivum]|uniref:uncharacterized protein n=1 Tax=Triticum aestivum TaxID=4565 RepID=UPI001D009543|nr:uncharacterized protein LOC123114659 [Triticum aestivum]
MRRSGSGTEEEPEKDDYIQEPAQGHNGQREGPNAATSPSNGARGAQGSAATATPLERPHAGGVPDGPSSVAARLDRKGKQLAPFYSAPSSAGSSPEEDDDAFFGTGTSSSKAERGSFDCKLVFNRLVQEQAAIKEDEGPGKKEKKPKEEQVKSPLGKEAPWSNVEKIFPREGSQMYSEDVNHQTHSITEVRNYYLHPDLVTEQGVAPRTVINRLDAYSEFRPVTGDGECFYRSFISSYLEQVLDRQDTHTVHLLDAVKRMSMQKLNFGWTSEFCRSYRMYEGARPLMLELAGMTATDSEIWDLTGSDGVASYILYAGRGDSRRTQREEPKWRNNTMYRMLSQLLTSSFTSLWRMSCALLPRRVSAILRLYLPQSAIPSQHTWRSILGAPIHQTTAGTCSICAITVGIESVHRMTYEWIHGPQTFPLRVSYPSDLTRACRRLTILTKHGSYVEDVLNQVIKQGGVLTTSNPRRYTLAVQRYEIFFKSEINSSSTPGRYFAQLMFT